MKVVGQRSRSQGSKHFGLILLFPDHNSSFKSSIAMKPYVKLLIILNKCPIDFKGRRSKVNVTWRPNFGPILPFSDHNLNLKSTIVTKCYGKLLIILNI